MVAPIVAAAGDIVDGTAAEGTTHPFDAPAGIVNGSLLVAAYTVEHNGSGVQLAAPSGWSVPPGAPAFQAVANGTAFYVFYKIVSDAGSEPSTYNMPAQDGRWVRGAVLRISGHNETTPWSEGNSAVAASSTDVPSTSITTFGADRLIIWGASSYNLSAWATMPAGFTEHPTYASSSSETTTLATMVQATAGTVTTGAIATGATAGKAAWLGQVRPADGSATIPGTAAVTLGALNVAVTAGPQTKTGTAAVTLGALAVSAIGFREPVLVTGTAAVSPGGLSITAAGVRIGTGAATVTLGALDVTASGSVVVPPGQLFDLSRWHLTLPTGSGEADQIDQPELATYFDENFFTEGGRMVGRAPVNGATTSGSEGTRAELREHEAGSYANSAWNPATTGRRQLTIVTRVDPTSITGGTLPRQEGIFFQIHGATGTPPIYLTAEYTSNGNPVSPARVRCFVSGTGMSNFNLLSPITPDSDIAVRCRVEDATLKLWAVLGTEDDLPPITATPNFERPVADFTDDTDWYFKTLAYNKTETGTGSTGETISRHSFIELLQPGDPEPGQTVSGTAAVTLGALSMTAAGRHTVHGSAAFSLPGPTVTAVGIVFAELVTGTATVTLGALSVTATGVGIPEQVDGTASVVLGAASVSATGTRETYGEAGVILGGLVVTAAGGRLATGTAVVSLGSVSVTAVGTVVAEVVTGSVSVPLGGVAITAVGSRSTAGTAAVTLPGLVAAVLGTVLPGGSPRLTAGTPTELTGPSAATPTPLSGPVAGQPTTLSGLLAGTPIER